MDAQRRWIAYDTFKLIVALILLVLILILLLQRPAVPSAAGAVQATEIGGLSPATQTPLSPTNTSSLSTATLPLQASRTPTLLLPATTSPPPTTTPTTVLPTATPASSDQPTPTPTDALATATPAAATLAAATATTQPQSASVDCPLAQPSRLAVGNTAQILANLNLRSDAGIDKQILGVGLPTSQVEIMGGPICTPYQNGAYLWWNVRSTDGQTEWSAEATLSNGFYFLQPVP